MGCLMSSGGRETSRPLSRGADWRQFPESRCASGAELREGKRSPDSLRSVRFSGSSGIERCVGGILRQSFPRSCVVVGSSRWKRSRDAGASAEPLVPRVAGSDDRSNLRHSWLPCGAGVGARRSAGVFARPPGLLLFGEPLPAGPCGAPVLGDRLQSGVSPPACLRWPGFEIPGAAPGVLDCCPGWPRRRQAWFEPWFEPLAGCPAEGFVAPQFSPVRTCGTVRGFTSPAVDR